MLTRVPQNIKFGLNLEIGSKIMKESLLFDCLNECSDGIILRFANRSEENHKSLHLQVSLR